jgi:hypothetical protein
MTAGDFAQDVHAMATRLVEHAEQLGYNVTAIGDFPGDVKIVFHSYVCLLVDPARPLGEFGYAAVSGDPGKTTELRSKVLAARFRQAVLRREQEVMRDWPRVQAGVLMVLAAGVLAQNVPFGMLAIGRRQTDGAEVMVIYHHERVPSQVVLRALQDGVRRARRGDNLGGVSFDRIWIGCAARSCPILKTGSWSPRSFFNRRPRCLSA